MQGVSHWIFDLYVFNDPAHKNNPHLFYVFMQKTNRIQKPRWVRSQAWKLLLGTLPRDRAGWENVSAGNRELYSSWVDELEVDPSVPSSEQKNARPKSVSPNSGSEHVIGTEVDDHPLAMGNDSKWAKYFANLGVLEQIQKDVSRTHTGLQFFAGEGSKRPLELTRLLFIYAKLNPGIGYVQGMNEILAPLLYVIGQDEELSAEDAEADTFFAFNALMAEIRDHFVRALDGTHLGINGSLTEFFDKLKTLDPLVRENLDKKQIAPQYFGLRWMSLLMSQEFALPDVLRLWDSLFADPDRFAYFHYFCCAMVLRVRNDILTGDFADTVKLLQNYPPTDINSLLSLATSLRDGSWIKPPDPEIRPDPEEEERERRRAAIARARARRSGSGGSGGAGAGARKFFAQAMASVSSALNKDKR